MSNIRFVKGRAGQEKAPNEFRRGNESGGEPSSRQHSSSNKQPTHYRHCASPSSFASLLHSLSFLNSLGVPPPPHSWHIHLVSAGALSYILGLIMGGLVCNAAQGSGETARSSGRDIQRLMDALRNLKWLFAIQAWLLVLVVTRWGLAKALPFFIGS